LIMLNLAGVLTGERLATARRYAIFGLVVFAGLVVPGNDPITMGALAAALVLLYEVAVQVTLMHDRRLARRGAAQPAPARR
ncbi:MAG: twin-arginine translocase subunit TatC, partial [Nakamurella multipartita]